MLACRNAALSRQVKLSRKVILGPEVTLSRNLGTSALNPSCRLVGIHKIRILYFLTVFYVYCKLQIIPNKQARDKVRAKSGRKIENVAYKG